MFSSIKFSQFENFIWNCFLKIFFPSSSFCRINSIIVFFCIFKQISPKDKSTQHASREALQISLSILCSKKLLLYIHMLLRYHVWRFQYNSGHFVGFKSNIKFVIIIGIRKIITLHCFILFFHILENEVSLLLLITNIIKY